MIVRQPTKADRPAWAAMRERLWPECEPSELDSALPPVAFVAEAGERLVGFAEASIRSYAEGAPAGPAAYLEGIWVEPDWRRRGIARSLLSAIETWARREGLAHLGSDALLDNDVSHRWHAASGFGEVERLVVFGKSLADPPA